MFVEYVVFLWGVFEFFDVFVVVDCWCYGCFLWQLVGSGELFILFVVVLVVVVVDQVIGEQVQVGVWCGFQFGMQYL